MTSSARRGAMRSPSLDHFRSHPPRKRHPPQKASVRDGRGRQPTRHLSGIGPFGPRPFGARPLGTRRFGNRPGVPSAAGASETASVGPPAKSCIAAPFRSPQVLIRPPPLPPPLADKNLSPGQRGEGLSPPPPLRTDLTDEIGERIGRQGNEFGTVTGRKRRCGWFDAVLVRQTCITGGVDGICLTKLDVLDGFDEIKVCVGYEVDGQTLDHLPADALLQARLKPVYETLEGWTDSTRGARSWAQLPANAIKYVRRVEELIGAQVSLLSTSPDRDDTIMVVDPFVGR